MQRDNFSLLFLGLVSRSLDGRASHLRKSFLLWSFYFLLIKPRFTEPIDVIFPWYADFLVADILGKFNLVRIHLQMVKKITSNELCDELSYFGSSESQFSVSYGHFITDVVLNFRINFRTETCYALLCSWSYLVGVWPRSLNVDLAYGYVWPTDHSRYWRQCLWVFDGMVGMCSIKPCGSDL